MPVAVDGHPKTVWEIAEVASGERVEVPEETISRMLKSRRVIEDIVDSGKRAYGVNTGFGKFAEVAISEDSIDELQENLVLSHATGLGPCFSREEVRAAMFLRANALAAGYSGARPEIVQILAKILNADITPLVPERGSVGASGDLAPMAHIALTLLGKGQAVYRGQTMPSSHALASAGLMPLRLKAKEGLALTNGIQMSTAVLALTVKTGFTLCKTADVISSLSGQALLVIQDAFDPRIAAVRPHDGVANVIDNYRRLLNGSLLATRQGELRTQDPYVLRCIPQVHGAVRQSLNHAAHVVEIESASATDNPLVFDDGSVISGGNFHGQPVALASDYVAEALCSIGNMSERRISRLLDTGKSGLPPFLTSYGGTDSGLMIWQYTAASLASESKTLSHPASVDSIPTSADQEDHVSMSTIAARKAREIARNVARILAIELVCALQGLEYRGPSNLSPAGLSVYRGVRNVVFALERDRFLAPEVEKLVSMIEKGEIVSMAEAVTGPLS